MELIRCIGDSIHPSIQLEIDFPSRHIDKKMQILDIKVWTKEVNGRNLIMYEHYTKEVATKAVIKAKSALPTKSKRTILMQELLRIMTNCSENLQIETREKHMNNFLKRLQYSGFYKEFRYDIVNAANNTYKKIKQKVKKGERKLHRPKDWKRTERKLERRTKKNNWYKKGDSETVIFVPYTELSKLKKMYQNEIKKSNCKIEVVEKSGRTLKSILKKTTPFKEDRCKRQDCFICSSEGSGQCDRANITYTIECEPTCKNKGVYCGETGENGYTRGKEHLEQYENKNENSVLWRHCREIHNNERKKFTMNKKETFGKASMLRQISESVMISRIEKTRLINNKREWNIPQNPDSKHQ